MTRIHHARFLVGSDGMARAQSIPAEPDPTADPMRVHPHVPDAVSLEAIAAARKALGL